MLYLGEREIGFDADALGFPSIDNCRAFVLVTAGGLAGFHCLGNLTQPKIDKFVNFITALPHAAALRAFYVASNLPAGSESYATGDAKTLALALGYAGPTYLLNVNSLGRSSFVRFQDVGHRNCVLQARVWNDATDRIATNVSPYVAANRDIANGSAPAQMWTNVDETTLKTMYPEKIS